MVDSISCYYNVKAEISWVLFFTNFADFGRFPEN